MGLAAQGFCSREEKSVTHHSAVVTGYDKHPQAAAPGHRVIRWHSLGRAAAPFCWVRDPSPQQPPQWPFVPWQCDTVHFISYWEDVKLSDTHSSQATLFNKEHIITDISCRGLRLLSPSSVFYLYLFCYIFSASSAFPPQDCSCWFSHWERSECVNGTTAEEGSGVADSMECAFPSESVQNNCLTVLRTY